MLIFETQRGLYNVKEEAERQRRNSLLKWKSTFHCPSLLTGQTEYHFIWNRRLLREELETLVDDLIQRLDQPCENCLQDAGLQKMNYICSVGWWYDQNARFERRLQKSLVKSPMMVSILMRLLRLAQLFKHLFSTTRYPTYC